MRYENFAKNEHYHLFGGGPNKEKIFIDDEDKARFVFLITHFQSPLRVYNVSWYTQGFLKNKSFSTKEGRVSDIVKKRNVELLAFVVMPNHFHLIVQNLDEGILSVYMQRVLTAYGKYFNVKYHKRGHVFGGPFKAVHIKNNDQLLNLSSYIHKSPKEIKAWENSYDIYPYSSFQDYTGSNRWGNFLSTKAILKHFKDQAKYKDFVDSEASKEGLDYLQNEVF
jgi:putative transposase